jgi:hypothetical protein
MGDVMRCPVCEELMELNDTCPSCLRDQFQPLNRTRTGRRIAAYTQSATPEPTR